MKSEIYKNWRITTERDLPSCCGLTHYTDIVKLDLSTKSRDGIVVNADVNGAANIGRKCKQNFTFEELSSGFLANPKRIRVA